MPHTNQTQNEQTDGTVLTDPAEITVLLEELGQQSAILTIRPDPEGLLFESSLARVEPEHQHLYIEELRPEIKPALRTGHVLILFVTHRGVAMRFAVTLERTLLEQGRSLLETHFPTEIQFFQRREIFRVHVPIYDRRDVRVRQLDDGEDSIGRLVDISIKGFCLEVPEDEVSATQIGVTFRYGGMQLPDVRTALAGEAAMVNLRPSPRPGFSYAGFNILDMDPQTERALMRAALFYQRDARKAGR